MFAWQSWRPPSPGPSSCPPCSASSRAPLCLSWRPSVGLWGYRDSLSLSHVVFLLWTVPTWPLVSPPPQWWISPVFLLHTRPDSRWSLELHHFYCNNSRITKIKRRILGVLFCNERVLIRFNVFWNVPNEPLDASYSLSTHDNVCSKEVKTETDQKYCKN